MITSVKIVESNILSSVFPFKHTHIHSSITITYVNVGYGSLAQRVIAGEGLASLFPS